MPQSSVFVRLQWPSSSSSESSHDFSPFPSSGSSIEASPMCDRDIGRNIPLNSHSSAIMDNSDDLKTTQGAVSLSRSHSFSLIDLKCNTDSVKESNGKKVKLRKKNEEIKARRMVRSLSSTSTASTSTDPEDFFYACTVSRYPLTLPPHLKEISPRIIIPSADVNSRTELNVESSPNIPYLETKDNDDQESKNSSLDSEGFLHSYSSIFSKLRERTSKTFSFPKRRLKLSHNNDNTLELRGHDTSLHSVEEVAEENIPDIVNDCKVNIAAGFQDYDEGNFELREYNVESSKSQKKSVTFLLPPLYCDSFIGDEKESPCGEYPPSGYAELDGTLMPPNGRDPYRNTPSPALHGVPSERYVRWRDPDLHEVIDFLSNPNNIVKANAAAYLQHLCYMDDATKQKTRILGGIPPLVALLAHDLSELHRNACGALRNLSYGRQNDENKRAIKDAGGLPALVRLLRKTLDNEVKELVTGILWNLSSCEDLKQSILDETLGVLVSHVIIPCSGWDGGEVERDPNNDVWWSTVFKNASGIIRNISSAGEYARTKLRHCPGLVDSLFCVIKLAIQGNSHDNKSVENCVCILRNLSYRCQEVEDPNYDKHQPPTQSRATAASKGDNLGCFGGSRKKKEMVGGQLKDLESGQRSTGPRGQPVRGMELLWQPELVVQPYLALLSDCSNPETLEAAAGAIQNLAACYWQPSIDVRAAVRKEKGLPILVELLRMEVDRVVCAVATALRNLAIDQRNKELIGKYAMRDLVQKLPSQNSHDATTSDETIAAVLATLNEVIKRNAEFSRSLLEAGGVDRLVYITRQRGRYSTRVVKFASQVLFSMWGHQELREVYKKAGWKEQDFVSKSVAARNAAGGANSPTANNTLNRPMASQGGTRYEDRTIQRSNNQNKHQYQRREEVPLADLGYGGDGGMAPGGVRTYGLLQGKPGEPVYAKVNREKKRNRQYDSGGLYISTGDEWGEAPPAYSAIHPVPPASSSNYSEPNIMMNPLLADAANNNEIFSTMGSMEQTGRPSEPAGDSWV